MSFSWNITAVEGRPGPERALVFNCTLNWHQPTPIFLTGLYGSLGYKDRTLCSTITAAQFQWPGGSTQAMLQRDQAANCKLIAPLSAESISFIENDRTDDITLSIALHYQYQKTVETNNPKTGPVLVGAEANWNTLTRPHAINHSEWLKRLKEMGWTEVEIVEIPKLPLMGDKNLEEALRLIGAAQTALRNHDFPGVLEKCRQSFESAAKHESAENIKEGFELLFARAFPNLQVKQDRINELVSKLSAYAHLGRHAQYPAIRISRAEAELVFTTTVSLFSLLGRRLTNQES